MTEPHRFRSMGCGVLVAGASVREGLEIERLFAARDRRFSRFIPESELNRVNVASGRPVRLSREFAEMLELALAAAEQTGGLVDPTLGKALEAAGYNDDFSRLTDDSGAPGPAGLSALGAVRLNGQMLCVPAGVHLDLNGVVKGKTVDEALQVIRGDGFVSAGGDIAVRGGAVVSLPGGGEVQLLSGALATSGRDRRHWTRGGQPQHHLIDPGTGLPSRSPWETVTVCGATCIGADVGAKAAFLLGEHGPQRMDEWGLPARFVHADGQIVTNEAWRRTAEPQVGACT